MEALELAPSVRDALRLEERTLVLSFGNHHDKAIVYFYHSNYFNTYSIILNIKYVCFLI